MIKLTDDEIKEIKNLVDHFDREDRSTRESQIRKWKQLKLYWDSLNKIYWSETAKDWKVAPEEPTDSVYDKPVNIYRAYLESIIAAMSATVPAINCYPDDADNALDISTAKAGNKIAEIIYKHIDINLLWIQALYVYCTEGLIAAYNYTKESEAFGTYEDKQYEDEIINAYICPYCDSRIPDELIPVRADEYDPDGQPPACPTCFEIIGPELTPSQLTVTKLVGVTQKPKSRQCVEVYGGLYVKVPNYAKKQEDIPYLIFSYETHYANALEAYPDLREKIKGPQGRVGINGNSDTYEQWARLSSQYKGEYPENNVTVRNCWFRPSAYNVLDEKEANEYRKDYPNGMKVVLVNDHIVDIVGEALDDHWTLSKNPLSDHLHHDPLGMLLISVQDITNDLISLILQTIEHGIPQTFADPSVLDFKAYGEQNVRPGDIFPARPKTGKSVGDGFYEVKTASLSHEVLPFATLIQELGQLVSGALPSLFGGAAQGSKTASEYSMSRQQALQRLQTPWKLITVWWKEVIGKIIPAYIKNMAEDERLVEKDDAGNFINVFIRRAELQGRIGNIELEPSDQLPVTWAQKKDVIMSLMQAGNPIIMQALMSPENIPLLTQAFGLTEFEIPGEDDRTKQYEEIQLLMKSEPIMMPPDPAMAQQAMMMGLPAPEPQEVPSIQPDPDLDNHEIEMDVCRRWLVGEAGRLAKTENPTGYRNVLLHLKAHQMIVQQMMMQQAQAQLGAGPSPNGDKRQPDEPPNPEGRNQQLAAPIQEGNNAIQ